MSDENLAGSIFIPNCYPLNAAECNIKFQTSTYGCECTNT